MYIYVCVCVFVLIQFNSIDSIQQTKDSLSLSLSLLSLFRHLVVKVRTIATTHKRFVFVLFSVFGRLCLDEKPTTENLS